MNSNFRVTIKRKKKKKHPRILLEWKKGTGEINRIRFPIWIRSLSEKPKIRVRWGWKQRIRRMEIDTLTTLTELNQFLNSLVSQNFKAKGKITIYYPESLHKFLSKNEERKT